jgi:hypothetical protein
LHIYSGGIKSGSDQQKDGLDDIRSQGPVRALIARLTSSCVTNNLDC